MYICNCNGVSDTDIKAALEGDCDLSLSEYLKSIGFKFKCGKCSCHLKNAFSSIKETSPNKNLTKSI